MKEALDNADGDLHFQAFLARLFGTERMIRRNFKEMHGYEWRNRFYVVKVTDMAYPEPKPNQDSQ